MKYEDYMRTDPTVMLNRALCDGLKHRVTLEAYQKPEQKITDFSISFSSPKFDHYKINTFTIMGEINASDIQKNLTEAVMRGMDDCLEDVNILAGLKKSFWSRLKFVFQKHGE